MMQRLHIKFGLLLALLMIAIGAGFFWVESHGSRLYHEELMQRINAPIAMYIAGEAPLIDNGVVNTSALATLAERAMIINPTAEIYLLSTEGDVLGSSLPGDAQLRSRVSVQPILDLLGEQEPLPIPGADPRIGQSEKVFSVSPVIDGETLAGYVYVILGGSQYAEAVTAVKSGYQQRLILAGVGLALLAALLIGSALSWLLTRPLRRLTERVHQFQIGETDDTQAPATRGDELQTLGDAFDDMATRIASQVARIRESDRLRRELITNVSHDLRTPLAAMQGYLETLMIKQHSVSDEEQTALVKTAQRHAERLGGLVQDLFELTRLDTGSIAPQFEPFSLAELVNDVAQEFAFKASASNITLKVIPPTAPTTVLADIALIQRVLENLIDNALKYTPHGGVVSIRLNATTQHCAVAVADNGSGIDSDHLPHIFERHYAASKDASLNSHSTGLGLAIVKKILDLHGSQIAVHSVQKRGTRFHFELPAVARAA